MRNVILWYPPENIGTRRVPFRDLKGQNQGRRAIEAGICQAVVAGPAYARSATEPARAKGLFAKHAPKVERFGKDKALQVRRQADLRNLGPARLSRPADIVDFGSLFRLWFGAAGPIGRRPRVCDSSQLPCQTAQYRTAARDDSRAQSFDKLGDPKLIRLRQEPPTLAFQQNQSKARLRQLFPKQPDRPRVGNPIRSGRFGLEPQVGPDRAGPLGRLYPVSREECDRERSMPKAAQAMWASSLSAHVKHKSRRNGRGGS